MQPLGATPHGVTVVGTVLAVLHPSLVLVWVTPGGAGGTDGLLLVGTVGDILLLGLGVYVLLGIFLAIASETVTHGDSGSSALGSLLLKLLSVPVLPAALILVQVRLLLRSDPDPEIVGTVRELRGSLETLTDHRQQVANAARPPGNRAAVDRHLGVLATEWRSVAEDAGHLGRLVDRMDVTRSPGGVDGLYQEWTACTELWAQLRPHDHRAPLPGSTNRAALKRAVSTIQQVSEHRAGRCERMRERLDSDPERVLADLRDSRQTDPGTDSRTVLESDSTDGRFDG